MRVQGELKLGVLALLGVQILMAFGAIGLLTRMSPAIERILQENVVSLEAGERMLAVLADETGPQRSLGERRAEFDQALAVARSNITEEEERPLLARIEDEKAAALTGDGAARARLVRTLLDLARVNTASMRGADAEAQRLGAAGAWAAVFLAALSLLASAMVVTRLLREVGQPLLELDATLLARRAGDSQRRCRPQGGALELQRLRVSVNALLDAADATTQAALPRSNDAERLALLALMDRHSEPLVLLGSGGELLAGNRAALALPPGERRARVDGLGFPWPAAAPPAGATALGPDAAGWLVALPAPPEATSEP